MVSKVNRGKSILASLDWSIVFVYLLLVFIGWISIYAAVYDEDHSGIVDMSQRYGMQLIWIFAGLVVALVMLLLDVRFYSVFANYVYLAIMLLLVFVLFFGIEVNGAKSWIAIGNVRLQPAEMAKVATALALAKLMSGHSFKLDRISSIAKIATLILIPVVLIFLQHDVGSALVFVSFIIMFYREGLSGWVMSLFVFLIAIFFLSLTLDPYVIYLIITGASFAVYAVLSRRFMRAILLAVTFACIYICAGIATDWLDITVSNEIVALACCGIFIVGGLYKALKNKPHYIYVIVAFFIATAVFSYSVDYVVDNVLEPHQRVRIENLVGKNIDLQKTGYNVHQSEIAIGSGRFTGKGFLQGTQTRYNYVPEQSTDFIFCTIGEEWGFIGCFVVITLYLILSIRLVLISERQKSTFARIYGYCVVSIIFFHFFINIAMTIGLAPVIGIPLPFISYGGSSLWTFTALLFIMLKLDASRFQ
ncbi:MAG: rod shape-determining protein RodA [Prevotellaceae bacterium]|jgi:rod shape determining protein RodA|nr:rod shape-determining protein RodA [Prevotellaceae bacterium]